MSKPTIIYDKCVSCGVCVRECTAGCITLCVELGCKPVIELENCVDCLACEEACPTGAITR